MEPIAAAPVAPPTMPEIVPDFLWLVLFFFALYAFGAFFSLFYSQMIGQIIAGVLFMGVGTKLLRGEELFSIAGWIGLGILVFEGGASLDMNLLRKVFIRASILAFIGSLLPVAFGIIYLHFILSRSLIEAVASGASLASTSIAVALVLMQQHKIVETRIGTLLTAAAMLDDVFSLVLVAVVSSLGPQQTNNPNSNLTIAIIRPVAASIAVLIVGTFAARFYQRFLHHIFENASSMTSSKCWIACSCTCRQKCRKCYCASCRCLFRPRRRILASKYKEDIFICFMCFYAFAWSITAVLTGSSYLIGAFVAGLAFASDPSHPDVTHGFTLSRLGLARLEPLKTFLLAIFFGSIGFSLRTTILFEKWALLYGALIYTIIMIVAKFLTGIMAKPLSVASFLTVGTAMIGRGELGLYLSEQAQKAGVMSQEVFAATTWALILNTLVSPILFGFVVKKWPLQDAVDSNDDLEHSDADTSSIGDEDEASYRHSSSSISNRSRSYSSSYSSGMESVEVPCDGVATNEAADREEIQVDSTRSSSAVSSRSRSNTSSFSDNIESGEDLSDDLATTEQPANSEIQVDTV